MISRRDLLKQMGVAGAVAAIPVAHAVAQQRGAPVPPPAFETLTATEAAILEAAVIGVPDTQWGEAVKAVVVLKPESGLGAEELLRFCKERLSAYKVPKSVEFRSSLPHTEVGKVNKVKLKELILAEIG